MKLCVNKPNSPVKYQRNMPIVVFAHGTYQNKHFFSQNAGIHVGDKRPWLGAVLFQFKALKSSNSILFIVLLIIRNECFSIETETTPKKKFQCHKMTDGI